MLATLNSPKTPVPFPLGNTLDICCMISIESAWNELYEFCKLGRGELRHIQQCGYWIAIFIRYFNWRSLVREIFAAKTNFIQSMVWPNMPILKSDSASSTSKETSCYTLLSYSANITWPHSYVVCVWSLDGQLHIGSCGYICTHWLSNPTMTTMTQVCPSWCWRPSYNVEDICLSPWSALMARVQEL